jgi:hypothetical protein
MAKLARIFFISLLGASVASFATNAVPVTAGAGATAKPVLQLELVAQTELPAKATLDGHKVGGLSGINWTGSSLMAVSDDRGKFGTPRYYEMELKIESKSESKAGAISLEFKPLKAHLLTVPKKDWVLNDEAVVVLQSGTLLVSTEGDTNKKPRALPHIFEISADGKFKTDIPVPEKFLPEALGQQTKGIENNRGFEGLTVSPDEKHLFAINESPLLTETAAECSRSWVRLVEFEKDGSSYKAIAEYPYQIEKLVQDEHGTELFRGVSEMLYLAPQNFLILERGLRLTSKGLRYSATIYSYDISDVKDVSKSETLCLPSQASGKKTKLIDLAAALKSDTVENFEGLSWGPALPDGRRTLLVISDNNFSSKEKTQLLVFAVKETAQ